MRSAASRVRPVARTAATPAAGAARALIVVGVVVAALRRAEAFVRGECRQIDRLAEAEPFVQPDHGDRHPAVGHLIHPAWRAGRADRAALEVGLHHAHDLQAGRRLQQARLDVAPARFVAPGVQRRGYSRIGVQRGAHVDGDDRRAVRNAVLAFVLHGEAGVSLQDRVHRRTFCQRADLAEARHRQVDDARFAFRHRVVAEAEPVDHAGPEALEEHIGALDQPPQDRRGRPSCFRSSAIARLPRLAGSE